MTPSAAAVCHSGRRLRRGYSRSAVVATTPDPVLPYDMSDSQNITATPYPFYATGGDSADDSFRAALTSHSAASVERNQDSQFAAARSQAVHRDVEASKKETIIAKTDVLVAQKDHERRDVERWAEIKTELAVLRAEATGRELARVQVELADAKNARNADVLLAIAKKLGLGN